MAQGGVPQLPCSTADTGTPLTPRTNPGANLNGWRTLWWTQG